MAVDLHGQQVEVGEVVFVRARVAEMTGDVLHLETMVPTTAYPNGTRINVMSGQVEKLEIDEESETDPLNGDGTQAGSASDDDDDDDDDEGKGEEGEGEEGGEGEGGEPSSIAEAAGAAPPRKKGKGKKKK